MRSQLNIGGGKSTASRRNDTTNNDKDSNNSNINDNNCDRADTKNDEDMDTVLSLPSLSLVEYLVTEGMALAGLTKSNGSNVNSEKPPTNLLLGMPRSRTKTDEEVIEDIHLLVERLSSNAGYSSGRGEQHASGCGNAESDNTNKVMDGAQAQTKKDTLPIENRERVTSVAEIINTPYRSVSMCVQPLKAEKGHVSGAAGSASPSSFSPSPTSSPPSIEGWTPLHAACRYHSISVIEHLLKLGADPRATDDAGWYPLELFLFARDHNLLDGPGNEDKIISGEITLLITLFVKGCEFPLVLMQQRETEGCRADRYADSPRVRFHLYSMGLPATQIGLIKFIERGLCRRLCGCDRPQVVDTTSHAAPTGPSPNDEDNNDVGSSPDTFDKSVQAAPPPSFQRKPRMPFQLDIQKTWQAFSEGNVDRWGQPTLEDEVKPREIKKVFEVALANWAARARKNANNHNQQKEAAITIDLLFHRVCEYYPELASTILDSPASSFVDPNYVPMDSDFSSLSLLLGAPMRGFSFRPSLPAVRKIIRQFAELGFNFSIMWRGPAVTTQGSNSYSQNSTKNTNTNDTKKTTEEAHANTAANANADLHLETERGIRYHEIICDRNQACVSYLSELVEDSKWDSNNNNNNNHTHTRQCDKAVRSRVGIDGRWCVSPSSIDPFLLQFATKEFEVEVLLDLVKWSMLGVHKDRDGQDVGEAEVRRHVVYGDSDDEEEEEEMFDRPAWMPDRVTDEAAKEKQNVDAENDMMRILDKLSRGEGLAAAPSHVPVLPFLMNRLHDNRLVELARAAHRAVQAYHRAVERFYFAREENAYDYEEDEAHDDDDDDGDEEDIHDRVKKILESFGDLSSVLAELPVFGFSPSSSSIGAEEDPNDNSALRAIRKTVFRTAKEAQYRVDLCLQHRKLLSNVLDIFFALGVDFSSFRSLIHPTMPGKGHFSNYFLWKVRLFVKFNDASDEATATCPMTLARKSKGSLLINNGVYDHATYYGLEGTIPILIGLGESGTTLFFLDKILSQGLLSGSLTNSGDRSHVYAIEEALRYRLERGLFDSSRDDFSSNTLSLYWYEKLLGKLFDHGVITPDDLFWYLLDFAEFYHNSYRQHALEMDKVRRRRLSRYESEDDADISLPPQESADHDHRDGCDVASVPKLQSFPQSRSLYNYRYVLKHLLTLMGDTAEAERARKLYGGSKLALWEDEEKFSLGFTLYWIINSRGVSGPVCWRESDEADYEEEGFDTRVFSTENVFIGDGRFRKSKEFLELPEQEQPYI